MKRLDLERVLTHLRALPFVQRAEMRPTAATPSEDARLRLQTPQGRYECSVSLKDAPLTRSAAANLISVVSAAGDRPWMVFSRHITRSVAQLLVDQRIGFVDEAGNCHLAIGEDYLAHIEGRRPPELPRQGRGLGPQSYQVLFALLAKPEAVNAPIRSLADLAGVRKTTVARMLTRLEEENLLVRDKGGRHITQPAPLLDRWLVGYADKLRPRLLIGKYRPFTKDPQELQTLVAQRLGEDQEWAWGGVTAAYNLTQHYRGEHTILHIRDVPPHFQEGARLLPATDGPFVILAPPGPVAFEGPEPHLAHPLLIYTELLVDGGERARETAEEVKARYLPWLR
jgi:hypothetical protein